MIDSIMKEGGSSSTTTPPENTLSSPFISTQDVLQDIHSEHILEHELHFGNSDLIKAIHLAGIAGPFKVINPWELADSTGNRRIHAGGYAALPFGERYPPLLDFIAAYLKDDRNMGLPQQSITAWRAALEYNLIQLLAQVAPSHADSQVFFSNSGAEAIECAIKFVKAYRPKASYIINFKGGYHGKTFGALSLTPNEEYQALFRPLMANVVTLDYGDIDAFSDKVVEIGADKIAGVVIEPIQGEAGVIIPPKDFLSQMGSICHQHGIITVADEIQVGLARSGFHFASIEWGGFEPDIITLAKPLGGGVIPVGATIARKHIFRTMLGGLSAKRHSNTFGGNSLAMAIGLKSFELIVSENLAQRARRLGEKSLEHLKAIQQQHDHLLEEVRGIGFLFALQFKSVIGPKTIPGQEELIGELSGLLGLLSLHESGIHANLSLNAKRTIRLTPALTMPEHLLHEMFERVQRAADNNSWSWEMLVHTNPRMLFSLAKFALSR